MASIATTLTRPIAPVPAFRPDRGRILAAIRATLPAIADRAGDTERNRQVPPENVAALRAAGLYRIVQPAEFGGFEHDFALLAEVIQDIGAACASTAWVCGLQAAHQWLLASFPIEAQHDVWDADPDALLCGSYAPAARAAPVDGGYRLSGRWSFASGCDVSDWAFCAAMIPAATPDAGPRPAFLLVPRSDYDIDDDWHVVGLAGTGSKTLVLDEVFVPAHRLLLFADTTSGNTPGARHYTHNATFRVPMLANIASCLASAGLGAAMGALRDYLDWVGGRTTRGAVAGAAARIF